LSGNCSCGFSEKVKRWGVGVSEEVSDSQARQGRKEHAIAIVADRQGDTIGNQPIDDRKIVQRCWAKPTLSLSKLQFVDRWNQGAGIIKEAENLSCLDTLIKSLFLGCRSDYKFPS